jgi:DNA-binding transcriptional ArsR family regulator
VVTARCAVAARVGPARVWRLPAAVCAPQRRSAEDVVQQAFLTRLSIPALPKGTAVTGLALSPDGGKLAVEVDSSRYGQPGLQEIMVPTLAIGTLLPILRSQQQGEILALLLSDPDLELSLTEISARTGAPHPSVHREIERAEQAGLVTSRKMGNVRLVRANTASPYYPGLADVLTRAFGVPGVLAEVLSPIDEISAAYVYGSWAARHEGEPGLRPVGDVDVLVLGDPDRDELYAALSTAEQRLGRPVDATIRAQPSQSCQRARPRDQPDPLPVHRDRVL